jgi:hypothetical protein
MSHRRFSILRVGDLWRILGHRHAEEFPSRDAVALATARLAAQAVQDGYQVELVITKPLSGHTAAPERRTFGQRGLTEEATAHTRYRENSGAFAMAVDRMAARKDAPRSFQQVWSTTA